MVRSGPSSYFGIHQIYAKEGSIHYNMKETSECDVDCLAQVIKVDPIKRAWVKVDIIKGVKLDEINKAKLSKEAQRDLHKGRASRERSTCEDFWEWYLKDLAKIL